MTYEDFIVEWRNGTDSITAFTSGSTGVPKSISLPRQMLEISALRTIQFFRLSPATHFHSCISPDFIGGKMMAVRAEILHAPLTYEEPSNQLKFCYSSPLPDFIAVVPSQLWSVLDIIERGYIHGQIDELRKCIFLAGGSRVPPELAKKCIEAGLNCWESYGMTETASHIALKKFGEEFFRPLPGIAISLDHRDCLVINLPDYDQVITNDMAVINPDKSFRILGRFDNVIVSGGKKINPESVESRLTPGLRKLGFGACMAFGKNDKLWGEKVCLALEPEKNASADIAQAKGICDRILSLCRARLEKWEVPKEIHFMTSLPRTPSGKLSRNQGLWESARN